MEKRELKVEYIKTDGNNWRDFNIKLSKRIDEFEDEMTYDKYFNFSEKLTKSLSESKKEKYKKEFEDQVKADKKKRRQWLQHNPDCNFCYSLPWFQSIGFMILPTFDQIYNH
jgi:hypothetical protein